MLQRIQLLGEFSALFHILRFCLCHIYLATVFFPTNPFSDVFVVGSKSRLLPFLIYYRYAWALYSDYLSSINSNLFAKYFLHSPFPATSPPQPI